MKKIGLIIFSLFALFVFVSQDVGQQTQDNKLTTLSSSIKEELQNLRVESELMKSDLDNTIILLDSTMNLLNQRAQELKLSEQERQESQILLTDLSSSLQSMNSKYNDSLTKIIILEERLSNSERIQRKLWIALIIWTSLKLIRIILGFIPATKIVNKLIPWWLDVLI